MVEVLGADRVRVEVDAAEVGDPGEPGGVVDDDLVGGPPGREGQRRGPDELGQVLRRPLLEERLAGGAVDEALERHRPAAGAAQRALGDRQVVLDEVELGVARLREVDLARVRDRHLAPVDREDLLLRRHGQDHTASTGGRDRTMMPRPVEFGRRPFVVHEGGRRGGRTPTEADRHAVRPVDLHARADRGAAQEALREPRWRPTTPSRQHLRDRGAMLGGEALDSTATATTVRVVDGRTITTDGPFAETKETLGGFYLVEAADLDEAIAFAAMIPGARHGCIEVRPDLGLRRRSPGPRSRPPRPAAN